MLSLNSLEEKETEAPENISINLTRLESLINSISDKISLKKHQTSSKKKLKIFESKKKKKKILLTKKKNIFK